MPHSPHQTVAILVIGNEVLSGRTREANAYFAAQTLFDVGCKLVEVAIVADHQQMIVSTLQRLRTTYDAVLTSGGIGPTHDDITMQSVADCFAVPLLEHEQSIALMLDYYGKDALNEGRRRMARLPQGAVPILCEHSIAPAAKLANVYVFAGVPHIFESQLLAVLDDFKGKQAFQRQEVEVMLAESSFAADLGAIQAMYPMLEIGSYPARCGKQPCGKICVSGLDMPAIKQAMAAIKIMLKDK